MSLSRPIATAAAVALLACAGLASPAGAQPAPSTAAQPAPAATPAPATAEKPADPVVARVGSEEIHLSDLADAQAGLPEEYRKMPAAVLYPLLLNQVIDRKAVFAMAQSEGLEQQPEVQRELARAREQTLQNALISREVGPLVTEAAVRARYDRDIASKQGEEEVHARHILVSTEDEAKKVIADLKAGGDFAAIAKARSKDPQAAAQGGDLGFFKKSDMLPEFADAAFALKPGQTSETPVKTSYGWHVIKVEERRVAPPQPYEEAHDELRQQMIQEAVKTVVAKAVAAVKVERMNLDGTPIRPTDAAEPPPAGK
jgi:peptidyl-prolyl cis-trans isomerase C